jgi:hypothetical protein
MGKRSPGFERRAGDTYVTPRAAVEPLIAWLRRDGVRRFAEPCAGNGALVQHLESFGLRCVYAGDVASGQDALARADYGGADAIITNPPWTRSVMHTLIGHFCRIAPAWLLIEADWASTWQAAPYLPACSDIVAIGRVKWIAGSKHTGKDNICWFRFDGRHSDGPRWHWRDREATKTMEPPGRMGWRECAQCGQPQAMARVCTGACRR